MNIVMPMAGRGSRFAQVGYHMPKPLIPVRGKPMYAWATDSLPLPLVRRLIFIAQADHLNGLGLREDIAQRYGSFSPHIVALTEVTSGQAATVLTAREYIDEDVPLLIYNADTACRTRLASRLEGWPKTVAGALGVFAAPGDKWSFAKTDGSDRVIEVAEKRRISEWACTGLYYFRSGRQFVHHATAMIADNETVGGEHYVAPVYNRLLREGADIRIDVAEEVNAMGTPEDLEAFLRRPERAT